MPNNNFNKASSSGSSSSSCSDCDSGASSASNISSAGHGNGSDSGFLTATSHNHIRRLADAFTRSKRLLLVAGKRWVGLKSQQKTGATMVRKIERASSAGRIILFAGPRSTGKSALAVGVARELEARGGRAAVPCVSINAKDVLVKLVKRERSGRRRAELAPSLLFELTMLQACNLQVDKSTMDFPFDVNEWLPDEEDFSLSAGDFFEAWLEHFEEVEETFREKWAEAKAVAEEEDKPQTKTYGVRFADNVGVDKTGSNGEMDLKAKIEAELEGELSDALDFIKRHFYEGDLAIAPGVLFIDGLTDEVFSLDEERDLKIEDDDEAAPVGLNSVLFFKTLAKALKEAGSLAPTIVVLVQTGKSTSWHSQKLMKCFEPGFTNVVFFEADYEEADVDKILEQRAKAHGVRFEDHKGDNGKGVIALLKGVCKPRVAPRLAVLVLQEIVGKVLSQGEEENKEITKGHVKTIFMNMFG